MVVHTTKEQEDNKMSEQEHNFLKVVDLKKGFGSGDSRQEVLRGMDFAVAKGEFCVLLGPSGSGKSTLLNIIGGIDGADSGYISINGDKLKEMDEKTLTNYRRKHLGYVFQLYNLIPNLTVKENIEVGAYLSDKPLDIDELLVTLGLWDHRNKLPNQLSGGQQQRVAVVRGVINSPEVLYADEPTGALNSQNTENVLNILSDLNGEGQSIVMVTHTLAAAERGNRVIYLADGVIADEVDLGPYVGDYKDESNPMLEEAKKRHAKLKNFLQDMGW